MAITLDTVISLIVSGIFIGTTYSLLSMGLSIIWGVMNLVNFAHGEYMMIGAFISYFMLNLFGVDPRIGLPIVFIIVFALGVLTQKTLIDRLLDEPISSQVFATFALSLFLRYGVAITAGPFTRQLSTSYTGLSFSLGNVAIRYVQFLSFGISILVSIILYLFLTRTYTGIALRATSQDSEAAQLQGINIRRMYYLAFGLGVGITAIGGSLVALYQPIYPEVGGYYSTIMFVVVVLGGLESIFGAFFAGILIGVLEMVSTLFITPVLKDVVAFIIFIIIIMYKPTGIFSRRI